MSGFRKVIDEAHRRSLWQVLGIFLAASWGVVEVVDLLTEQVGLPDWTPTMAVVLLLIGLPIVLATAFVQEGMPGQDVAQPAEAPEPSEPAANIAAGTGSLDRPSTRPSKTRRMLTWRNAIMGGLGAFTLLGVSLVGYFVMWTTGIGPFGNLVAQGVIEDGDQVVLAVFADRTGEGLGDVVTEALRVDLAEASVLDLVEDADLLSVFGRMQLDPGTRLTADLARDAAVREGIKAVIDGEVATVGTGYLITATIRQSDGGRSIASFRVTAEGPDDIIASIDKLSQDIREKSGETLRSIKSGEPLISVTTSSLEALQLFTEADRTWDRGEDRRTLELLDQAVDLDPAFAMAWRRIAALQNNIGTDPLRAVYAATQAFEHRARLTERERYLAEGYYYSAITEDRAATIAAYQNALRIDPDDRAALNNLGNEYMAMEDWNRASEIYRQAVNGPGISNTAFSNLMRASIGAGDFAGAQTVYEEYAAAYPNDGALPDHEFWAAFINGDLERAQAAVEPRTNDPALPAFERADALDRMGQLAYWQGRLDEGRRYFLAAERAGSEVSSAFEITRRDWTIYSEWAVGDVDWAAQHAREMIDGGFYDSIENAARNHFFVALNLSLLGDQERFDRVRADWEAAVPEEGRGAETKIDFARTALYMRAAAGNTEGVFEEMRALAASRGCSTCYRAEVARLAELEGLVDEAIRIHQGVVEGGFSFFELNGPYRLRSTLALGPLYEEAGDTAKAIEAYQRLVDQWANADTRGMRKVNEARARIAALGG